jgi:hypothetical protein
VPNFIPGSASVQAGVPESCESRIELVAPKGRRVKVRMSLAGVMLGVCSGVPLDLPLEPMDMRKSDDEWTAFVRYEMGADISSSNLFVFHCIARTGRL